MNEILSTLFFATHEGLVKILQHWNLWILPVVVLSIFSVFRLLTPKQLVAAVVLGILGSWLLVKSQGLGPREILTNIFGIPLPLFTMMSLVVPLVIAVLAFAASAFPTSGSNPFHGTAAVILITILIGCQIEILMNTSLVMIRSQDHARRAVGNAYLLGGLFSEATILLPVPALVGALTRSIGPRQQRLLQIFISACALAASAYVFWRFKYVLSLRPFFQIFGF